MNYKFDLNSMFRIYFVRVCVCMDYGLLCVCIIVTGFGFLFPCSLHFSFGILCVLIFVPFGLSEIYCRLIFRLHDHISHKGAHAHTHTQSAIFRPICSQKMRVIVGHFSFWKRWVCPIWQRIFAGIRGKYYSNEMCLVCVLVHFKSRNIILI